MPLGVLYFCPCTSVTVPVPVLVLGDPSRVCESGKCKDPGCVVLVGGLDEFELRIRQTLNRGLPLSQVPELMQMCVMF